MPTVEESPCPSCKVVGTLALGEQLVASPLGSHSLSGSQVKFSARHQPVLTCSACGLRLVGQYDQDGRRVTFDPPSVDGQLTPTPEEG